MADKDNLTGKQIDELEKLNLLNKGMREKRSKLLTAFARSFGRTRGIKRNKKMGGGMAQKGLGRAFMKGGRV